MPEGRRAADQLERILYILPAASRDGGARLDDLARQLEITREEVMADLTAVTTRAFYHPAGSGSDLQISLSRDHVSIWTTGEFRRPVRLSLAEAVCLGLALRGTRGDGPPDPSLEGLERSLATADPGELMRDFEAPDLQPPAAGIRDTVIQGLREGTAVRLGYLRPGDQAPSDRLVHPYSLAHGEGQWYLLAHCQQSGEVRVFRFDRILSASAAGKPFQVPASFDPAEYLQGHRVYRGSEETTTRVRYSPRIARWIAEREPGEWDGEGGFTVTHQVADPRWIVRHVLQYGPDARVLEPEEARGWVREAVRPWLEEEGPGALSPFDPPMTVRGAAESGTPGVTGTAATPRTPGTAGTPGASVP
jgi:proteasome accessory factor C